MAQLSDPGVAQLLAHKNHAVVSSMNEDGSIHSTVVWVDLIDGQLAVNSAVGRKWPTNLERDPRITVLVYDESNPYDYVEVRGAVTSRLEGADDHIDRLAKKYLGVDSYPLRTASEQRVTFLVQPSLVRHQKQ
ncbi:MAG: class putative F420-dependent enzyme [Frankiales bacterium]|nr:class putative F420-dependent enzyme [Frankiales bacterium]